MKYFFETAERAEALRIEAESWLGTPFREYSKAKGKFGGVDCAGFVEAVMQNVGASIELNLPREPADYQPHALGDKILDYFRGKHPSAQSKIIAARVEEIELPEDKEAPLPAGFFMPGDLPVLQHGELFHLPIMIGDRKIVSALPRLGVRRGTIQDSTFKKHFVAMFRPLAL